MTKHKCRCTLDGDRCDQQTASENQVCKSCKTCKEGTYKRTLARKVK